MGKTADQLRIALYTPAEIDYSRRLAEGLLRFQREHHEVVVRDFRFLGEEQLDMQRAPAGWDAWRPDGAIIFWAMDSGDPFWLHRYGCPVVNTCADCPHDVFPRVTTSMASVAELTWAHFLRQGYPQLGYVGLAGFDGPRQRYEALQRKADGDGREVHYVELAENPTAGLVHLLYSASEDRALLDFLRAAEKPIGIATPNDGVARTVCLACESLGLSIPDDVGVLGVSNELLAQSSSPSISSICLPGDEIGYRAMQLLVDLIAGKPAPDEPITVDACELITRESTGHDLHDDLDLAAAQRVIRQQACTGVKVADVVERFGVSRSTFESRYFKRYGCSPGEELLQARMGRARDLLKNTDESIEQIADATGYGSGSNFSRAFRNVTGLSPRQYRICHKS